MDTICVSVNIAGNRSKHGVYEGLLSVSRDRDWTGWCQFFLEATTAQAEENLTKTRDILKLYEIMKNRGVKKIRSQYAILALDWIIKQPIFSASNFVAATNIPNPTARRLLHALRDGGILREMVPSSGRRAAVLVFGELLNIAEVKNVF